MKRSTSIVNLILLFVAIGFSIAGKTVIAEYIGIGIFLGMCFLGLLIFLEYVKTEKDES